MAYRHLVQDRHDLAEAFKALDPNEKAACLLGIYCDPDLDDWTWLRTVAYHSGRRTVDLVTELIAAADGKPLAEWASGHS